MKRTQKQAYQKLSLLYWKVLPCTMLAASPDTRISYDPVIEDPNEEEVWQ